jgi:hypothetical protein
LINAFVHCADFDAEWPPKVDIHYGSDRVALCLCVETAEGRFHYVCARQSSLDAELNVLRDRAGGS